MGTREVILSLALCIQSCLAGAPFIPITLEHAITSEQRTWGLMGRTVLPQDHGMLFAYPYPQKISVWMFNCFMDLSVAFLDDNRVITEIKTLKAYPEMMDHARPVRTVGDISLYPAADPVVLFFYSRRVTSSSDAKYALEMEAGWFEEHSINVGDQIIGDPHSPFAYIIVKH